MNIGMDDISGLKVYEVANAQHYDADLDSITQKLYTVGQPPENRSVVLSAFNFSIPDCLFVYLRNFTKREDFMAAYEALKAAQKRGPTWHEIDAKTIGVGAGLGIPLSILFFFDQGFCSIVTNAKKNALQKPGGFHWDLFLVGCINIERQES